MGLFTTLAIEATVCLNFVKCYQSSDCEKFNAESGVSIIGSFYFRFEILNGFRIKHFWYKVGNAPFVAYCYLCGGDLQNSFKSFCDAWNSDKLYLLQTQLIHYLKLNIQMDRQQHYQTSLVEAGLRLLGCLIISLNTT